MFGCIKVQKISFSINFVNRQPGVFLNGKPIRLFPLGQAPGFTHKYYTRLKRLALVKPYAIFFNQGILTEGEGSVQLTSSLEQLVLNINMNLKRSLTKQVSTRRSTVPSLPSQLDFPASAVSPTTESKFYNVDTSTIRRPEFSPAPTGCPRRRPPPRSGRSPGRPTHPGTGTRWRRCPKFKTVDSYDRAAATLCTMTFS